MGRAPSELRARLEARRAEIEEVALERVKAVAELERGADAGYAEGLRVAVAAAVGYGIAAIGAGEGREPPIPLALLAQARSAARNGVGLDTVLRRYFAGYSLLGYFIVEEAGGEGMLGGGELQRLLGAQAAVFDRLLVAVGEEHTRELETHHRSARHRRAERIERLLAGEMGDTDGLGYELEGWHLGLLLRGPGAKALIEALARQMECRPLVLSRDEQTFWAWLGSRHAAPDFEALEATLSRGLPAGHLVAFGEPGEGLAGWRRSHRQAQAAFAVALRGGEAVVRYADVALLASAMRDELLVASLRQLYLEPLEDGADGGAALRETLVAYIAAGQNASSAAAALGVNRGTVTSRLRVLEERIGRPVTACGHELMIALRLELIGEPRHPAR